MKIYVVPDLYNNKANNQLVFENHKSLFLIRISSIFCIISPTSEIQPRLLLSLIIHDSSLASVSPRLFYITYSLFYFNLKAAALRAASTALQVSSSSTRVDLTGRADAKGRRVGWCGTALKPTCFTNHCNHKLFPTYQTGFVDSDYFTDYCSSVFVLVLSHCSFKISHRVLDWLVSVSFPMHICSSRVYIF